MLEVEGTPSHHPLCCYGNHGHPFWREKSSPQNLLHQPVDRQIDTNPSFLSVVVHTHNIPFWGAEIHFVCSTGWQANKPGSEFWWWFYMDGVVQESGWCWCAIHSFSSPVVYPILLNPVILISILKGHFSSSLTYYYQLIKGTKWGGRFLLLYSKCMQE